MRATLPHESFAAQKPLAKNPVGLIEKRIQLDLSGSTFDGVSLDRLFEKQVHRLTGLATIKLERCRLDRDHQVVDVAGSIRASEGLIGKSLLNAAVKYLDFAVEVPEGEGDIAYDRFAMHFSLLGSELKLRGACRQEINHEHFPVGVVLAMSGIPLAETSRGSLPSVRLMSVLAPAHSEWVPLARQNQELLWILVPPKHGAHRGREATAAHNGSRPIQTRDSRPEAHSPRIQSASPYGGGPTIGQPAEVRPILR